MSLQTISSFYSLLWTLRIKITFRLLTRLLLFYNCDSKHLNTNIYSFCSKVDNYWLLNGCLIADSYTNTRTHAWLFVMWGFCCLKWICAERDAPLCLIFSKSWCLWSWLTCSRISMSFVLDITSLFLHSFVLSFAEFPPPYVKGNPPAPLCLFVFSSRSSVRNSSLLLSWHTCGAFLIRLSLFWMFLLK